MFDELTKFLGIIGFFITTVVMAVVLLFVLFQSSNNREWVKERAETTWNNAGFSITTYEGYNWGKLGRWPLGDYGGAYVWYVVKKVPDNGIMYTGALQRWGDEVHIYNLRAIDAIQPK